MADEDKLLGVAYSGRTKNYTYSAYRVDYDSAESIVDLGTVVDESGENEIPPEFSGATKNPPAGYPGHEAKTNYQRKVLVEDETTRDEVTAVLDGAEVEYSVEDVAPTAAERQAINQYDTDNSLEGRAALSWMRSVTALENGHISNAEFEQWENHSLNLDPPTLDVEGGLLQNDGTDSKTITVSHPYSEERDAVLIVGDESFDVTLVPGENYTETMTTTKDAGSTITVSMAGNFLGPDAVSVEVVE